MRKPIPGRLSSVRGHIIHKWQGQDAQLSFLPSSVTSTDVNQRTPFLKVEFNAEISRNSVSFHVLFVSDLHFFNAEKLSRLSLGAMV
jgi:hypothetical protein